MSIRPVLQYAVIALALCECASGCTGADASRQRAQCGSWAMTSRIVAGAWIDGEVPDGYAQRTLEKATMQARSNPVCARAAPLLADVASAVKRGAPRDVKDALERLEAVAP